MVILLHSSKTMRGTNVKPADRRPQLINKTEEIAAYLKTLSIRQVEKSMHLSSQLASQTHDLIQEWTSKTESQTLAIDCFVGDIYSGLQASDLSKSDRDYADKVLWILSGLYGFIRPYDGIYPYRLEMGYKLPDAGFSNLYKFWGSSIAGCLPKDDLIVNVSSVEYTKAIMPFINPKDIVTPRFLTIDPKTNEPTFKVVHAKIARGAFARWLITTRLTDPAKFRNFNDLGYEYSESLSTPMEPAFVCREFGGKGLSVRLK